MENNQNDYYPGQWNDRQPEGNEPPKEERRSQGLSASIWICIICLVAALCVLLTYTFTAAANRAYYSQKLATQQAVIDRLQEALGTDLSYEKLALLDAIFDANSYFAGEQSEEELMDAVLKAYVSATGDKYAAYFTEEEYQSYYAENTGASEGIGVSIEQTAITVEGIPQLVFHVISIFKNAPAQAAGIKVGDYIYRVKIDGEYKTVTELNYTAAANAIRGEKGTTVELSVYRPEGNGYASLDLSVVRDAYVTESVSHRVSQADPTVGVVWISEFNLTTPSQLKDAVETLKEEHGVEKFVFDVRNNPGGDLQSIKAVMTYFLNEGDLILSSIDQDGKTVQSYVAEAMSLGGDYAACNVSKKEIGMYRDLDMVVLCNENTASAAEVFVATMRDYDLAPIVGQTTYGKGTMQGTIPLSWYGKHYTGYLKLTTHAYVTKCGIPYQDIGISPSEGLEVSLSEEAKQHSLFTLPEELDDQLKTAIAQFHK